MSPMDNLQWPSLLAPTLALITLAACSPPEHTVDVQICGDVDVPRQVDSIRVSLLNADRETEDQGIVELVACPSGQVTGLPVALSFSPIDGEGFIRVQGLSRGNEVIAIENKVELTSESDISVRLPLNEICMGVAQCTVGQTCVQGECKVAPPAGRDLRCQSDESSDTMKDTGRMPDAGSAEDTGTSVDPEEFDPRMLCPNYKPDAGSNAADGTGNDGSSSSG